MECLHLPNITVASFMERVHRKRNGQRIPWSGSIDVTNRCNLRCVHCYINIPSNVCSERELELTRRELLNILDQIKEEGCFWLLFTGGEPFIRPDFLDIYTHAKRKGFLVSLFSNGTTITYPIAEHLAQWHPHSLEITLYGMTKETYERITGVPGSYERCLKGIELLLDHQVPLTLKTMVMTENRDELWDMKAYADELGVEFYYDSLLNPRLNGDHGPTELRLSPQEVIELDVQDPERYKKLKDFYREYWNAEEPSPYLYLCGAGRNTFHIDSRGRLSACIMARIPNFDLRKGPFEVGWRKFMHGVITQERTRKTRCMNCPMIGSCGQCPGLAQIESGDPEEPVDYLCEIEHIRADIFGLHSQ